jgi:hypothetical protein
MSTKIRHNQRLEGLPPFACRFIPMRRRPFGANVSRLRSQCAKFVEKFFGTVGAELSFEDLQMLRIRPDLSKGNHLLRTENVHALYWEHPECQETASQDRLN